MFRFACLTDRWKDALGSSESSNFVFIETCVFVISGLFGFYNAFVTNPTTLMFVKVASLFGMGSTAQVRQISITAIKHEVDDMI